MKSLKIFLVILEKDKNWKQTRECLFVKRKSKKYANIYRVHSCSLVFLYEIELMNVPLHCSWVFSPFCLLSSGHREWWIPCHRQSPPPVESDLWPLSWSVRLREYRPVLAPAHYHHVLWTYNHISSCLLFVLVSGVFLWMGRDFVLFCFCTHRCFLFMVFVSKLNSICEWHTFVFFLLVDLFACVFCVDQIDFFVLFICSFVRTFISSNQKEM